ncbi:MAG: type II secretion system F family protein [Actinomycetota bacterium]
MSRRGAVLLICLLLSAASFGEARAQNPSVRIRKLELANFPSVELTVSAEQPDPEEISVLENGVPVEDFELGALTETGTGVQVVLTIDTSGSMEGESFTAAIAAARAFIEAMPEEIDVGIVAFSDRPRRVLPLTGDRDRALGALSGLAAAGETALYDSVRMSAEMFSGAAQRNIVLLSDGADTSSRSGLKAAVSAAKGAGSAIFAVGLRTPDTDVQALRTLAGRTGGQYFPVSRLDLSPIYRSIATELKNQFVITYESQAAAGEQVTLLVETAEGSDDLLFLAPKGQAPASPEPELNFVTPDEPLLRGGAGLVTVLVAVFLAVFLGIVFTSSRLARARRDRKLASEWLRGVPEELPEEAEGQGAARFIPKTLVRGAERFASSRSMTTNLDVKLERAGWALRPAELVAGSFSAAAVGLLSGIVLFQNPLVALLLTFIGSVLPVVLLNRAMRRRSDRLQLQLPDILMVLAASLRAGHSFQQAVEAAAREIDEPGSVEFGRVMAEIRVGRSVDDAMNALADRVGSEDFRWAVIAMNIQREVGGNLAEVLDNVAETMRERQNVRRQVQVLSAEGRLSMYILAGLPVALGVYLGLSNPSYIGLLFTTGLGLLMVGVSALLLVAGILWMRKLIQIDV